jgi:hypothetical protein
VKLLNALAFALCFTGCASAPSEPTAIVHETLGQDASPGSTCYPGLSTELPNQAADARQWWTCVPSQGAMVVQACALVETYGTSTPPDELYCCVLPGQPADECAYLACLLPGYATFTYAWHDGGADGSGIEPTSPVWIQCAAMYPDHVGGP